MNDDDNDKIRFDNVCQLIFKGVEKHGVALLMSRLQKSTGEQQLQPLPSEDGMTISTNEMSATSSKHSEDLVATYNEHSEDSIGNTPALNMRFKAKVRLNKSANNCGKRSLDVCEEPVEMRKNVARVQACQAVVVNQSRAEHVKAELEVGDICVLAVEGNTQAATDFLQLSVWVSKIQTIAKQCEKNICTRDGHLRNSLYHNALTFMPMMNATMLSIDVNKTGFKLKLSVMDASAMYNTHWGATVCQCKGDCGVNSRHMCRRLGKLCTSKCHKGRVGNTPCCSHKG